MAIVQELSLFSWKDFQNDLTSLGDLERLKFVIETMPDAQLIQVFRNLRSNGRSVSEQPIMRKLFYDIKAKLHHLSAKAPGLEQSQKTQCYKIWGPLFCW